MKTDDLLSLLAADATATPVRGQSAARQMALSLVPGVLIAALLMQLTLGVRHDLLQAIVWPMFWMKVLVPAAVAVAGFAALVRLARPGVDARASALAMSVPVLLLWAVAVASYVLAPTSDRSFMVWGRTWHTCIACIVMISLPIFAASFMALRQFRADPPRAHGRLRRCIERAGGRDDLRLPLPRNRAAVHGNLVCGRHVRARIAGRVARSETAEMVTLSA